MTDEAGPGNIPDDIPGDEHREQGEKGAPAHRPLPEAVLVGGVAAAAAVIDAYLVHRAGRPLPAALAAGAAMGVFVHLGLRWFRRRLAALRAARTAEAPLDGDSHRPPARGGWANPRAGQRAASRAARLLRRPGPGTNPLAGRGAPPGRPRGHDDRR